MTLRRRMLAMAITTLMTLALAVPLALAAPAMVDVCRARRDGSFRMQSLPERAAERVVARGAGGLVGDPIPGMPGWSFDAACAPVRTLLAEAWGVGPDGNTSSIAVLEDRDGDGLPSAGDVVRTASYPVAVDGSSFGSFTMTEFVVADGSIVIGPDGAREVRARSGCGTLDCWFFWAVLDEGERGYERYAEYRIGLDDLPTDNTSFFDGWDLVCEVECGVYGFDVLFVRTTSPSRPGDLVIDARVSPANDGFLQVVIGG